MSDSDAAFIAAARSALPKLIAVAEAAKNVCREYREQGPVWRFYQLFYDELEAALAALEEMP